MNPWKIPDTPESRAAFVALRLVKVALRTPEGQRYLRDKVRGAQALWARRTLEWADVNRERGVVVLRREHSKNGEPRLLPLTGDLEALIARRWHAREIRTQDCASTLGRFVFHRSGRPVRNFRKAWASACEAAGVQGTLFHDLRRSAVRNMDRAGVNQAVAMQITGHKTASVYRRYRIVDEQDLRDALARTQEAMQQGPPTTIIRFPYADVRAR